MQRIAALDGLRALAALVVVGFHCLLPVLNGGFYGVDLFFVLSGYLITGLLAAEIQQTGTIDAGRFYARRVTRLMPGLAVMLTAYALLAPWFFEDANVLPEIVLSGLYVSNASQALHGVPINTAHTWSLAAEMQFYIVWPFVLLALAALPRARMMPVLAAMFVAATCWRALQYWDAGWLRSYYGPDTHLSGLILGSILALTKWRPSPGTGSRMAAAGLGVFGILAAASGFATAGAILVGETVAELAAAMLIFGIVSETGKLAAALASPTMVRLGAWSYAIYLWHYPIARWTRVHFDPWVAFGITLPLTIALAALSYSLVERPLTRWGARRFGAARLQLATGVPLT